MDEITKKKITENNRIFSLCKICKKQCRGFRGLVDHMNMDHTDYKPWRCHLCDEGTAFVKTLYRHLKTKHNANRAYCPVCGKVYTRSQSLRSHVNTIHQDFLNHLDNDQPSQEDNNNPTEMVCDNELFQLIAISTDNIDFSFTQSQETEPQRQNIMPNGGHYQINGSVIRYCRK